ncbi:hypothetical protein JCM11641_006837 [Rhodosporidiobolus odoratus]
MVTSPSPLDTLPPTDRTGFKIRLVMLAVLFGYLVFAAVFGLVVIRLVYRRRNQKLFLWRLVQREKGRYIVGNQQLLEPIFTIITAAVFIAHLAIDGNWQFARGSYAVVAPMRLTTWIVLFV